MQHLDKDKQKWCVYMHINKINGKRYVGITKQKLRRRFQNGYGYKKQSYFWRAIQKYGWDNFEHIIVLQNETFEYACKVEKCLIKHYKTRDKNYGYNMTDGGDGMNGWVPSEEWRRKQSEIHTGKSLSEETKEKIRIANTGRIVSEETKRKISENHADFSGVNHPMYGKRLSEETRRKMSETRKGKRTGVDNPLYGIPLSEEHKEKLRIAHTGKKHTEETKQKISDWQKSHPQESEKPVRCIETGEIYRSINVAQRELGVFHIGDCCRGKIKSTKGLHFEFVNKEEL